MKMNGNEFEFTQVFIVNCLARKKKKKKKNFTLPVRHSSSVSDWTKKIEKGTVQWSGVTIFMLEASLGLEEH